MKPKHFICICCIIGGISSTTGQIIQSDCTADSSAYYTEIEEFAIEIALSEMANESHLYHDSIIIPNVFLNTVRGYISAYHNAISLSDSIVDYRIFDILPLKILELVLTFDSTSNCFKIENDSLEITNDTLAGYIDSLGLYADNYYSENEIYLSDTGKRLNMYGDFDFFYNIAGVNQVYLAIAIVDYFLPCEDVRSGFFSYNGLQLSFSKLRYCDDKSYELNWRYLITDDCKVQVIEVPVGINNTIVNSPINIFPNPFGDQLNIESNEMIEKIILYDAKGDLLKQESEFNKHSFNTSKLSSGMYFMKVLFKDGSAEYRKVLKIIK